MKNIFLWSALIVSFTGFLFGYDASIISGVNLPVKNYWHLSDWHHGIFIVSVSLWGTFVGALAGGYPTDRLGRKITLILVGVVFIISSVGTAFASVPWVFALFRFLGGLACGLGSIAAPTYLSEVSTSRDRGKFVVLFQLALVIGILVAYLSGYFFHNVTGADDWRWMLGIKVIPSLMFTVAAFFILESPRWLISKGKHMTTAVAQQDLLTESDSGKLFSKQHRGSSLNESLFSKKYIRIMMLATAMTFFNQFSGISFVLNYAPQIMEKAGYGASASLFNVVLIGVVNLIFTVAGLSLIDRVGRRSLLIAGSIGYIISLAMIACGFYFELPVLSVVFLMLFIVSHAIGQGAVIWVFLAEIFPTKVRAFGQAWSSGLLNGFAALITLFGAVVIGAFPAWLIFSGFAFLMVLQLLFALVIMPETKGVPLEEIEKQLT